MTNLITEKLKVDSSAIKYMVYNYDLSTLKVKFNYGGEYTYFKVSTDEFISMKYAPSIGKHFNEKVKAKYEFI